MSLYIVDISGVGTSKHDISKRKSNEGKIKKYRPISVIYWLFTDISDTISIINVMYGTKRRILQFWTIYRPKKEILWQKWGILYGIRHK